MYQLQTPASADLTDTETLTPCTHSQSSKNNTVGARLVPLNKGVNWKCLSYKKAGESVVKNALKDRQGCLGVFSPAFTSH